MKMSYKRRLAVFDPKRFREVQKWNIQCVAARGKARAKKENAKKRKPIEVDEDLPVRKKSHTATEDTTLVEQNDVPMKVNAASLDKKPYKIHSNPYEGNLLGKQDDESFSEFLNRLPASTTTTASGPWILLSNPQIPSTQPDIDIGGFKQAGFALLDTYLDLQHKISAQNPDKPVSTINTMLQRDRSRLETSIKDLARSSNILSGKWLIFVPPHDIDSVWATVAQHTFAGNLGSAAKVSTRPVPDNNNTNDESEDEDGTKATRLVCIYTADFLDIEDIKRVLTQMLKLKLVEDRESARPIYYKCDAYSYLDIKSGNEFKLKASCYSSRELFADMKKQRNGGKIQYENGGEA